MRKGNAMMKMDAFSTDGLGVPIAPIPEPKSPGRDGSTVSASLRGKIKEQISDLRSEFGAGGAALLPWEELGSSDNGRFSSNASGCIMPAFVNVGRVLLEESNERLPFRAHMDELFLHEEFPFVLPFRETSGICFAGESEELATQAQLCVLRILLSLHPSFIKFTLVDTVTMGRAMKMLSPLRSVLDFSVLVSDEQIESFLGQLQNEVMAKNTATLSKYDWLWQYNEDNPAAAEPYRIVMFASGKEGIGARSAQLLRQLLTKGNAARAGIYFLFCDSAEAAGDAVGEEVDSATAARIAEAWRYCQREMGHVVVGDGKTEAYKDGWVDTRNDGAFSEFRLECPSPSQGVIQIAQKNIVAVGKSPVKDIVRTTIPSEQWWTKTSEAGLLVPIGLQSGADVQYLSLGNGGIVHNALVGGSVGTGKTILLHDLILNAARLYSPAELRMHLLDYKEGTEFACYRALPHLENLSIGPNVEFGLDVLNGLADEIVRRAKRFKNAGVSNVGEFRKKTGETMPRHLVIIDEFQVLWTDPVYGERASSKMEDLVRRGRSFGLNFILSTQSLRGASLSPAAKESLGLRICLRLSESDCEDFLSPGNMVAAGFKKAGEAVYNELGGIPAGNRFFRSAYLSGSEISSIIGQLREKAVETDVKLRAPGIYEGDELVPFTELVEKAGADILCVGRTKGLQPVVAGLPVKGNGFRALVIAGGTNDKRGALFSSIIGQLANAGIAWQALEDGSLKEETDRWRRWNEGEEEVADCPVAYVIRNIDRLRDAREFEVQSALGGMLREAPGGASSLLLIDGSDFNGILAALNGADKSALDGILALDEEAAFGVSSKNISLRGTEGWWTGHSVEEGCKIILATSIEQ